MKGLESFGFDELLSAAFRAEIEGIIVPFLHINHLIQNKKAVNRPKDQVDVIYLERIKKFWKNNRARIINLISNLYFYSFQYRFII